MSLEFCRFKMIASALKLQHKNNFKNSITLRAIKTLHIQIGIHIHWLLNWIKLIKVTIHKLGHQAQSKNS